MEKVTVGVAQESEMARLGVGIGMGGEEHVRMGFS